MTENDIKVRMDRADPKLHAASRAHPAWPSFVSKMAGGYRYGVEPLLQAWSFYRQGWDARSDQERRR